MKIPLKMLGTFALAAVFLLGVLYVNTNYISQPGGVYAGPGAAPPAAGGSTPTYCDPQVTPDLDPNAYDIENRGTALTESTNLYRKVGQIAWNSWTQGTAITGLEIGAEYEFITGISTSDFTDNAYGPYFKHTVKCQETETKDIGVYNDEVETSLTATFYNTDNNAAAEVFTAGQVKTVTLKWIAGKDEVYGNPFIASSGLGDLGAHRAKYPNLLVLAVNTTTWDTPEKVYIAASPDTSSIGVEMAHIPCPVLVSTASDKTNYCYEAPVISDIETRIAVNLDADNTAAPADDGTAYLYASNFYVNSETGASGWGNENEDNAALGADAADSLTLDFT